MTATSDAEMETTAPPSGGAEQVIFAVEVPPSARDPERINANGARIFDSFVPPDEALGTVPSPLRFLSRQTIAK